MTARERRIWLARAVKDALLDWLCQHINNDYTIPWLPSVDWLLTEYFRVVSEIELLVNQPETEAPQPFFTPEQRDAMYEEIMRSDSDDSS